MKKHQLLEKAMRDYPAGTKFRSVYHGTDHISTGVFYISDGDGKDAAALYCSIDGIGRCVYCFDRNEWAIPVKPSILSGRVAIQVNNEREFKLLMEHYDAKGFKPFNKNCDSKLFLATYNITSKNGILITHVAYGDGYGHSQAGYYDVHGYKIIAFADFAAEVGIKVPVFVMTSEDGVPLYKGDTAHHVRRKFYANGVEYNGTFTITGNGVSGYVFSSYEAAEMWIREQNRPKEIRIEGDGGYAIVRKDRLDIQTTGKYGTPTGLFIEGEDLKRAFEAYQSLQEGKS